MLSISTKWLRGRSDETTNEFGVNALLPMHIVDLCQIRWSLASKDDPCRMTVVVEEMTRLVYKRRLPTILHRTRARRSRPPTHDANIAAFRPERKYPLQYCNNDPYIHVELSFSGGKYGIERSLLLMLIYYIGTRLPQWQPLVRKMSLAGKNSRS